MPWFWRSACLAMAARPLARCVTLARLHDPQQVDALQACVQAAREQLGTATRPRR